MRIAQDRLIFVALAALQETVDRCGDRPQHPGLAIRACLSFLFDRSDGDRHPYDALWQLLGDEMPWQHSATQRATMRRTHAQTYLEGIARSVGFEMTAERGEKLRSARLPKAERIAEIERAANLTAIKRNPWEYWRDRY